MNVFDDVRDALKETDPGAYTVLEVAGKLMAERDKKGISVEELSKLSGVPKDVITKIEDGSEIPSLKTVGKLAIALGLKITVVDEKTI